MIKTVIIDLGGVYFTNGTKNAITVISQNYCVPEGKVSEVFNGELGTAYRIGKITADIFWEKAMLKWGVNISANG